MKHLGDITKMTGATTPIVDIVTGGSPCQDLSVASNNRYKHYGGRGISVCKEWESFEGFLADMGDGYRPGLTIDRIDTNGGYSPENCRWVTQKVQQRNRTNNAVVDSEYGTMTIAELAEVSGTN